VCDKRLMAAKKREAKKGMPMAKEYFFIVD
jgi:hypothetical protein